MNNSAKSAPLRVLAISLFALAVAACEQPAGVAPEEIEPVEVPETAEIPETGEAPAAEDPLAGLPDPRGPVGTLPEEAGLEADTVMAARYGGADADGYIGVWAADEQSCGLIDTDEIDVFAIITPSGVRDEAGSCTTVPAEGTSFSAAAICFEEGTSTERQISAALQEGGTLLYQGSEDGEEVELVRCGLAPP